MKIAPDQVKKAKNILIKWRRQEERNAFKAATYVDTCLGLEDRCRIAHDEQQKGLEERAYKLILTYQTYGPYLKDFTLGLEALENTRLVRKGDSPIYEIDTPAGTYRIEFNYFDNHSTGW